MDDFRYFHGQEPSDIPSEQNPEKQQSDESFAFHSTDESSFSDANTEQQPQPEPEIPSKAIRPASMDLYRTIRSSKMHFSKVRYIRSRRIRNTLCRAARPRSPKSKGLRLRSERSLPLHLPAQFWEVRERALPSCMFPI